MCVGGNWRTRACGALGLTAPSTGQAHSPCPTHGRLVLGRRTTSPSDRGQLLLGEPPGPRMPTLAEHGDGATESDRSPRPRTAGPGVRGALNPLEQPLRSAGRSSLQHSGASVGKVGPPLPGPAGRTEQQPGQAQRGHRTLAWPRGGSWTVLARPKGKAATSVTSHRQRHCRSPRCLSLARCFGISPRSATDKSHQQVHSIGPLWTPAQCQVRSKHRLLPGG